MFTTLFLRIDRSRYEFADALVNFDPVNDWLLNEKSYLTWREWGQRLPGDSEPIALMTSPSNFIMKPKDWMGEELVWMGEVMSRRFANLTSTRWQPSNFRGLLGHTTSMHGVETKLQAYNALLASNEDRIRTDIKFPEWHFRDTDGPDLSFYEDGQVRSLYNRQPWQSPDVVWRHVLPDLVAGIRKSQSDQLMATV